MLHVKAGLNPDSLYELHGSLGYIQCSQRCCDDLLPVDSAFIERLKHDHEDWYPRCSKCDEAMRPNVMIFCDNCLVDGKNYYDDVCLYYIYAILYYKFCCSFNISLNRFIKMLLYCMHFIYTIINNPQVIIVS